MVEERVLLLNGNLFDGLVVLVIHERVDQLVDLLQIPVQQVRLQDILQVLVEDLKHGLVQVAHLFCVVYQIQVVHLVIFHGEGVSHMDLP